MERKSKVFYWNALVDEFGLQKFLTYSLMGGGSRDWDKKVEETNPIELWGGLRWECEHNNRELYWAMQGRIEKLKFLKSLVKNYIKDCPTEDHSEECFDRWKRYKKHWHHVPQDAHPRWVVLTGRRGTKLVEEGFRWVPKKVNNMRVVCYTRNVGTARRISDIVDDSFYVELDEYGKERWELKGNMRKKNLYFDAVDIFERYAPSFMPIIPLNVRSPRYLMKAGNEFWVWTLRNDLIRAGIWKGEVYV